MNKVGLDARSVERRHGAKMVLMRSLLVVTRHIRTVSTVDTYITQYPYEVAVCWQRHPLTPDRLMRGWRRKEGYLVSLVCFPQSTTPPRARILQQTTIPPRHFRWVEGLKRLRLKFLPIKTPG